MSLRATQNEYHQSMPEPRPYNGSPSAHGPVPGPAAHLENPHDSPAFWAPPVVQPQQNHYLQMQQPQHGQQPHYQQAMPQPLGPYYGQGPAQPYSQTYAQPFHQPFAQPINQTFVQTGHAGHTPVTLDTLNAVLQSTREQINQTMGVVAKSTGRTLTIVGTLSAIGAAVTMGVLGTTMVASAATGVGLPVAAAAGIAGAVIGLGGIAVASILGAAGRALTRRSIRKNPELAPKIAVLKEMRDTLLQKNKLNKAEKQLLRNVNIVLGKVDGGFGLHFKSQLKVAGKTTVATAASAFVLALLALAAEGGGGCFGSWSSGPTFSGPGPSTSGAALGKDPAALALGDAPEAWHSILSVQSQQKKRK